MDTKRPIEERIKPDKVHFIRSADAMLEEDGVVSTEVEIYNYIKKNSDEGYITSGRMVRDYLQLGRTTVLEKLRTLFVKGLVVRGYAVAKSGASKTIITFYVTKEKEDLLNQNKTSIKPKKRKQ